MDFQTMRRTMVDTQIRVNDVTNFDIIDAFLSVPREIYVPKSFAGVAYSEIEIQTSDHRALWTPRDYAKLLKAAAPKSSDLLMYVGSGAGYEASVASLVVDTAIALEDDEKLVDQMGDRFAEAGLDSIVAVEGSLAAGLVSQAPFDLIVIGGMVETVQKSWTEQLADGGRLAVVVQVDNDLGKARIYTKSGETVGFRDVFDCRPPKFAMFDKAPAFQF